jgi:CBS domain-containing protein
VTVAVILSRKGKDIVTAKPTDRMIDICRLLETHGIGAVVVAEGDDRVAGIVSERDFVRALSRDGAKALDQPVETFMTKRVITCGPDDTIAYLMERMTEGKFRHMPVVDKGKLLGIVSIGDVVKQRIADAEAESRAMREYIATG